MAAPGPWSAKTSADSGRRNTLRYCARRLRIDVIVGGVPKVVKSVALAVWVDDGGWTCIAVHSTPAGK